MPYRDLAAALARIEHLESELAALKQPRRRIDWLIVGVRVLASIGLVVAFTLFAWAT
jgi:hypothetical protein